MPESLLSLHCSPRMPCPETGTGWMVGYKFSMVGCNFSMVGCQWVDYDDLAKL
jgi:hypothetical protein